MIGFEISSEYLRPADGDFNLFSNEFVVSSATESAVFGKICSFKHYVSICIYNGDPRINNSNDY